MDRKRPPIMLLGERCAAVRERERAITGTTGESNNDSRSKADDDDGRNVAATTTTLARLAGNADFRVCLHQQSVCVRSSP